jgi:hypothetical protein
MWQSTVGKSCPVAQRAKQVRGNSCDRGRCLSPRSRRMHPLPADLNGPQRQTTETVVRERSQNHPSPRALIPSMLILAVSIHLLATHLHLPQPCIHHLVECLIRQEHLERAA